MGSFSTVGGVTKQPDVITVCASNAKSATTVSASASVTLPQKFKVTSVVRNGCAYGDMNTSYPFSASITPTYVIDDVSNPTLPVIASSSLGVSGSYSTANAADKIVVCVAHFIGEWV